MRYKHIGILKLTINFVNYNKINLMLILRISVVAVISAHKYVQSLNIMQSILISFEVLFQIHLINYCNTYNIVFRMTD